MNDKKSAEEILSRRIDEYNSTVNDMSKIRFNIRELALFRDAMQEFSDLQFKPKAGEVEKLRERFFEECSYKDEDGAIFYNKDIDGLWQWIQDNCLSKAKEV